MKLGGVTCGSAELNPKHEPRGDGMNGSLRPRAAQKATFKELEARRKKKTAVALTSATRHWTTLVGGATGWLCGGP